jgi:hypothetical protein
MATAAPQWVVGIPSSAIMGRRRAITDNPNIIRPVDPTVTRIMAAGFAARTVGQSKTASASHIEGAD